MAQKTKKIRINLLQHLSRWNILFEASALENRISDCANARQRIQQSPFDVLII